MRKKIKELMNREEGFTLVELLAVIVILGIIIAIAIPSVTGVISRAQDNATKASQDLAVEAARMYMIAEDDTIAFDGTIPTHDITIVDLVNKGYFEFKDGEDFTGGITITKTVATDAGDLDVDTYSYEYTGVTASGPFK